ncbi:UNVERIFIED_CONTAM: hypothetical protein Slati_2449200 [Sesamum latifolium]|uniref:Uncharacterized protein n=1 Tax=Sesamum latifolium TaxID=2727402 RepID=A0AAW2WCU1_9LAMI
MEGAWNWPPITNMESIEITHSLPTIHGGRDRILWIGPGGSFSSSAAYAIFSPPGPKDALPETHEHLFFTCYFATECLHVIRSEVFFHWPYNRWPSVIQWASVRWRGKHVINASLRALLASLVYHLWQERNRRIFQHITRTPVDIAKIVVSDIRELIICKQLPRTVSTRGLYRLWRIPWHVEGEATT